MSEFGPLAPPPPGGYPPLRPPPPAPNGLAIAARVFAVLLGLVSLGMFFAAFPARHSYRVAAVKGDDVADVLTAYELLPLVWLVFALVAYILTCLWLFECRARVEALAPQIPQRRSKIWVWLCWIVPVVNLWFPYQVVRDLRRGSHPGRNPSNALVGWWLAAWIGFCIVDRFASITLPFEGEIDIARINATLVPTQAISTALCLCALVFWLRIISDIMRGQAELRPAPMPPQPQWPAQQPAHWS
ncbi:DUF4328 domain-containing protein [Nocardioides dubius]|uniref:DUF4328 domain-containing protein n=1 Tax=Nocardioides dubius TaxID=317019 RepID=A0ABN1U317_9ACTN